MNNTPLTKELIKQLIKDADTSLVFVKPTTASSRVWKNFSYIYVCNKKQDFVSCDICKDVLHHTSTNGTSCMIKHQKSCPASDKNNQDESFTIKQYFRPKTAPLIRRKIKEKILNAIVEFVSLDCRAFELISGDGFVNFAQTTFDVGQHLSNTQNLNIVDLLPHPTTISRNVSRLYSNKKSQLINLCKNMKSYVIVVDFWCDKHTGVSFCGIALCHLNDNLKFYVFILGCYPYDKDDHTSSQVRHFVNSKLMEYHLTLDDSKFVVSDNENKMKCSFKDLCTRVGCAIHYLNKQVQHCFTTDIIDKMPVNCDIIQQMFNNIRQIVSHMNRAHKQSKLSRKLQSYSDTRFNGAFYTMDIFLIIFDELAGVLDRTFLNNYMLIDKDLLASVCLFLKPFDKVINELSCDTKPTIYKVLPLRQYLLNQCKVHPDDHEGIQQIKQFLEKRIQGVWMLQDIHYITTLLHPSMKNFHINPDLQEKAVQLVKTEITKRQSRTSSSSTACTTTTTTTIVHTNESDSQSTTPKGLLSYCFDTQQHDLKSTSASYDELKEYMALNVQLNEHDNILQFWLEQKSKYPILFSIVQDFYAVPASNTVIERLFSSSKNTITDKRTSLGVEKINQLLFLQKNLTLLKSLDEGQSAKCHTKETKRTMVKQSSSAIYDINQEQSTATTTKKFKPNDEEDIVLYDDDYGEDKENNENDFF